MNAQGPILARVVDGGLSLFRGKFWRGEAVGVSVFFVIK